MTTQEIVKLILQLCTSGGIVGLDAVAIVFMFVQGKSYLTEVPDLKDYLIYPSKKRQAEEMDKDRQRWQEVGRNLYRWLPPIILISLLLVATAIIICAISGAAGHDTAPT